MCISGIFRERRRTHFELIFSEVLLQRTCAETVAKYYSVFFNRFPDWEHLVQATDEELQEILKLLGLYKHRTARIRRMIEEYMQRSGYCQKQR